MLRANKRLIGISLLIVLIGILIAISIRYLPIFKQIGKKDIFQSDTLFYTGKNTPDDHILYLLMEYKNLSKDSIYVKRSIVEKNEVADFYHYFMVTRNDSLVLIKPVYEDESNFDSIYIDLRKGKIARANYSLNRLNSELQFIGYERYKDKNGKQDSLIIMYGCDINETGCFNMNDKHYWFFDRNFHLRKAIAENGIVFLIDKHFLE